MFFELFDSFASHSFKRVWIQQFFYKILTLRAYLFSFISDFRPINLSSKYVVKNSLNSHVSKRSDSDNHLIGNNSKRKPIHSFSNSLSLENLGSNIVWSSIKRVWLFKFFFFDELAKIEICQNELSMISNNYIILSNNIFTGLRSR